MGTLVSFAERRRSDTATVAEAPPTVADLAALRAQLDAREPELIRHLSDLDRGIIDLLRQRSAICSSLQDLRQSLAKLDDAARRLRQSNGTNGNR